MSAPVGHTCPDIDKTIDNLRDIISYVSYEIEGVIESMEELRNSNSRLRDWGEGLEQTIADKDQEIENLKEQIET